MTMPRDNWELAERIGAYAASELTTEEALAVEQEIRGDPEALRVAEQYLRMLALLGAIGEESPEVPGAVIDYAIRKAYVSAFFRQAEDFFSGFGRAYWGALVYYIGLKDAYPAAGRGV